MQGLVTQVINDFIVWIIIGLATWRVADGVKDSKVGQVVWTVVIGGSAYYFVKNPEQVLNFIGNLVSKIFGG
ncbi:TcpD family membrane protein [Streptococcus merionis]|uniref:TcpD family membrane protein n=1 Tax=Streptococcus merionis TaxID=400065 RepID=UPI003518C9E2